MFVVLNPCLIMAATRDSAEDKVMIATSAELAHGTNSDRYVAIISNLTKHFSGIFSCRNSSMMGMILDEMEWAIFISS